MDHQRRASIDGALGHRDCEISPSIRLGEGRQHRELRRRRGIIRQVQQESLALVSIAEFQKNTRRAHYLVLIEASQFRGIRNRLGDRLWGCIVAQPVSGQLPIEGDHMIGRCGVPFRGKFRISLELRRRAHPNIRLEPSRMAC